MPGLPRTAAEGHQPDRCNKQQGGRGSFHENLRSCFPWYRACSTSKAWSEFSLPRRLLNRNLSQQLKNAYNMQKLDRTKDRLFVNPNHLSICDGRNVAGTDASRQRQTARQSNVLKKRNFRIRKLYAGRVDRKETSLTSARRPCAYRTFPCLDKSFGRCPIGISFSKSKTHSCCPLLGDSSTLAHTLVRDRKTKTGGAAVPEGTQPQTANLLRRRVVTVNCCACRKQPYSA